MRSSSLLGLAVIAGITAIAPILGARVSKPGPWYRALRKPPQNPPSWVFGPAWSLLYTLSAISAWRVWRSAPSRSRRAALALWGVQHALNTAWSPLFFGAHRPRAALVDLGAMTVTAIGYTAVAARCDRVAALTFVPYVAWLGFAGTLNAGIVRRNPWVRG